jgi:hypothetical protein
MRGIKFIGLAAVIGFVVVAGWQVGSREVANYQLQEDLHDMASQLGARIGFNAPRSDDDYRELVMRKATEYHIDLQAHQVTVQRTDAGKETATIYLAVDYVAPVNLPGFSWGLHLTASSTKKS